MYMCDIVGNSRGHSIVYKKQEHGVDLAGDIKTNLVTLLETELV
jgi:hypothetical protein